MRISFPEAELCGSDTWCRATQSSGTEPSLTPPVTKSVNPEPAHSVDSTILSGGVVNSTDAHADAPVQTCSPPTLFSFPPLGPTGSLPGPVFGCSSPSVSSGFSSRQANIFGSGASTSSTGGDCASSTTPKYPFGTSPLATTTPASGRGSFFTEQGSRYPRYAPTPDLDSSGGQGKMIISISASNSHRHKSHEELRWEDYIKGDKGGLPAAHTSPFNSSMVSPSTPDHLQRTTVGPTHGNPTGFPFGYTIPTAFQRPHEPAGVSGCTACGATSSSSPSGHLGLNGTTTNPPSSIPGLFFCTYGSCPLLFGTPYPAAYGTTTTTTPAAQPYGMMFGTSNPAAQGITPAVQVYPVHGLTLLPFGAMSLQ
ncbi:hypothetical protein Bca4012_030868 [Brassica carinata]|uniref:Uncharacterized protein n=2 Tax=Brassica TaxID=3705 RepID=A0A8X7RK31_BRACI|nr:hypothetical protein Bca52824_047854 [Brassica carinata]CAF1841225.1 unnamed protein product [Brassica napus]